MRQGNILKGKLLGAFGQMQDPLQVNGLLRLFGKPFDSFGKVCDFRGRDESQMTAFQRAVRQIRQKSQRPDAVREMIPDHFGKLRIDPR